MTTSTRTQLFFFSLAPLALALGHGCGGEPSGPELTVAASASSVSTSGVGGEGPGTGGAGGAGGDPTATTTTSGMGGAGGMAEEPIHGCTSALAVDMTAAATVTVNLPAGPSCVRMSQGQQLVFTIDQPTMHRYLGGTYDDATMVKSPSATSPIVSCCDASPYTCCPPSSPPITMSVPGAFPWYDDKNPGTLRGVVYVE